MKFRRKFVLHWMVFSSLFYGTYSATNFKPHFTNTNPVISIAENTNKSTVVYVLTATDTENDAITYSLDDTGKELFDVAKIDNNKANLLLKVDLNRELTSSYTFKAFVTDVPSDASKTGDKIFYVTVLDVNDNAPIFTEQPYRKSIPENTTVGTQLLTIQAVDADSAANGAVQYRFSNDSSSDIILITLWKTDKFEINNVNGHITLIAPLDYETTSRYVLSVIAEDRGVPVQKSETTVVIDVTDLSDMPPKFQQSIYITEISENSLKDTSVIKVVARDGDTGVNNPIKYEMYQGNLDGSFAIDASSGLITVNGTIDAEKIQSYTLYIRASEVPAPSSNTTVKVLITVIDKNDNPPILSQASYYFPVREDQAVPGRMVTNQLIVTDADKTPDYRRFTYELTGGDSSQFSIDPNSGILKINNTLDYETQINYTFTIVVTETGTAEKFSDNATVLVTLINVNDNEPKFQQTSFNYTFDEEILTGTSIGVIRATDGDLGTFGVVTYDLKGDDAEYFQVDSNTGNITAAKTLDYENKPTYTFRLHARDDGGLDYKEAVATIYIVLNDVNDNDPIFTKSSYSKTIKENLPANTSVLSVTAIDDDNGEFGRVSYSIISGNIDNAFNINDTGYISTTKPLDRETTAGYTLKVRAYDHGSPSRNTTIDVIVTVEDVNDNAPIITQGPDIYVNISEDAGGGSEIFEFIPATDADSGNNQRLIYLMSGDDARFILNRVTGRLQISPTGLDRETKSSYTLVINVTDEGIPQQYNTTTVHITILDVNDNAPEFVPKPSDSTYTITVNEGPSTINSTIININATDKDYGNNSDIRYKLTAGDEHDFFHLDPITGVLTAIKELDRENNEMPKDASGRGRFFLDIKAEDQAEPPSLRKSATVRVTVYVEDINDNIPKFTKDKYEIRTSEATLSGSNIIQVSANDDDWDNKGKVSYNITAGDPQGNFGITPNGYIVIMKTLDAEVVSVYNLTVTASDHGNHPLTSQINAVIYVDDVNDNDPAFNQSKYTTTLNENVAKGTSVTTVYATDKDKGANGNIIYKISNGNKNNAFIINNVTGEISTATATIDRETTTSYLLTIQAQDQGLPSSRKDFAEVEITIQDENDNNPSFLENSYTGEIPENSPNGTTLKMGTAIKATDKDIGDNAKISFSLSGPGSDNFVINNTTAIITTSTTSSLDRERIDSYYLTVTAIDGGGRNATANLTVTITDVNDESPRFSDSIYYANVSEAASRGTNVRRVTATDNDLGINKQIIYTSTGADAKFYIDRSTGDIKLDSSLDREFKSLYILNITAVNIIGNVPDGHAQVYITVTDVIDDKPYFSSKSVTTTLLENATVGTNVTKVTALDKDVGDTLIYKILSGDTYSQFSIDNSTGQITTVKDLDRENTTQYTLEVEAKDTSEKLATLKVIINVIDVNDNDPVFKPGGFIVDYREQSPKGTSIMTVSAIDADEGVNAEIRFSIVENVTDYINVNPESGLVTQGDTQLDRELYSFFNFTVKATDQGVPPRSSEVKVALNLIDINDNNPSFGSSNKTFKASVKENQPKGTYVIQITGTDMDLGSNAELIYGLSGAFDFFQIDEKTGNITTKEKLNREQKDVYNLIVRARDNAFRPRDGSATLVVTVLDDNDHSPVFTKNDYTCDVIENVAIGHTVDVEIKATDKDIHENSKISYFIVAGNENKAFALNATTGALTTLSKLDRETNTSFTLVIKAKDHGSPPRESNSTVTITIKDFNDNAPQFTNSIYNTTLKESTATGTQVTTVVATDVDEGQNSQFTFKIESGDVDNIFKLDELSGVVTLNKKLDHEKVHLHRLNISAKDGGTPSLKSYTLVQVKVVDVDDNPPEFTKKKYNVDIYENTTQWTKVIQVNATDVDSSAEHKTIHYEIVGGNDDDMFAIGELNGTVTLKCGTGPCLDRETKEQYVLTLLAISIVNNTDRQESETRELTIKLLDVNDQTPVFTNTPYTKQINEDVGKKNTRVGDLIMTISAKDKDFGINAEIIYTIVSGNENGVFILNNDTGKLTKAKLLDREKTASYRLVIKATDKGVPPLSSTTNVSLTIKDLNDNEPNFTKAGMEEFYVKENITVGTVITQENATDIDEGTNSIIRFEIISGNNDGAFKLDPINGTLKTAKPLDHESKPVYQLSIEAKDTGTPVLRTSKTVKIFVTDLNDNIPQFTAKIITYTVGENQQAGAIVGTIIAVDFDKTDKVYYYIVGGVNKFFALDEFTGILTTKKELDREEQAVYILDIKASNYKLDPNTLLPKVRKRRAVSNSSAVAVSSIQRVTIKIGDTNDNPPKFKNKLYTGGVSDSIKHGAKALLVAATDADSGNNSRLAYSITSSRFSVEKETGWIKAASSFAGETGKEYTFMITAKDNFGADPSFNDSAIVTIYVLVDKQRAVLVSARSDLEEVRKNQDEFKRVLENITGYIINIDDINYYQDENGNYDKSKTALLFHAVDPKTKKIVDRDILIEKIDKNYPKQAKFFDHWKIKEIKEFVPPEKKSTFDLKLALAVGFGILLLFLICIFCFVLLLLRKRQKRRLRAAQAQSYGGSTHVSRRSSMSALPNTNLHDTQGSNPIWVDPYHNWGMDDDDETSDYQTVKMNGSVSNGGHYYDNIKVKPSTNNPLFDSRDTYMTLNFDNNESADVDLSTFGRTTFPRKDSDNRTPSPEPYESSPPSDHRLYDNADDKYQVTSI